MLFAGCAGLRMQMVDRSVQRPSNIAVYFTVDTTRGEPVADLKPTDFHIYEDGRPVSLLESKQTILQPEVVAAHYTLLLVDMSGSVTGSPDMQKVVEGAASFAELVGRYQKLAEDGPKEDAARPDLILIDGGLGQLHIAMEAMQELGLNDLALIGVSKGVERKAGLEQLIFPDGTAKQLRSDDPALHLIQQIRDEAHRFAITGHRQRRAKARTTSILEEIAGIGPKRRQRLLKQFGGLQELARAGVEDIARVDGIGQDLAQHIYDTFHGEG